MENDDTFALPLSALEGESRQLTKKIIYPTVPRRSSRKGLFSIATAGRRIYGTRSKEAFRQRSLKSNEFQSIFKIRFDNSERLNSGPRLNGFKDLLERYLKSSTHDWGEWRFMMNKKIKHPCNKK